MNGAITDPWLATNSAPNSAIVIISGASQNFLRTRKKAQNSPMKPCIRFSSELPSHTRYFAFRRCPADPIAGGGPIGCETQRPFAGEPHDQRHRADDKKEQYRQNH